MTLKRGNTIISSDDGQVFTVPTHLSGWVVGDLLFWPGLIVDGLTGNWWNYPDKVTVPTKGVHG